MINPNDVGGCDIGRIPSKWVLNAWGIVVGPWSIISVLSFGGCVHRVCLHLTMLQFYGEILVHPNLVGACILYMYLYLLELYLAT